MGVRWPVVGLREVEFVKLKKGLGHRASHQFRRRTTTPACRGVDRRKARSSTVRGDDIDGGAVRRHSWLAAARRKTWNFVGAIVARGIQRFVPTRLLKTLAQNIWFVILRCIYRCLGWIGGMKLDAPEKTVNYSKTKPSARYAFT